MLTRTMAAELQKRVEELTAQLEEQNTQIATLSQRYSDLEETRRHDNVEEEEEEEESAETAVVPAAQSPAPAASTAVVAQNSPRIPDLIKMVPEFNGYPRNLPRWLESVEEKLAESKIDLPQNEINRVLPVWLGIIRDKITEKANDALSASHNPLDWDLMKTTA